MTNLASFYPGETVRFIVSVTVNGIPPNVVADDIYITFKLLKTMTDAEAAFINHADVITDGANGNALFELTPAETALLFENKVYHYDIVWEQAGGRTYVLITDNVKVLDRVSDA